MDVVNARPLDTDEAARIDAYWRAANYLAVGQIYLMGNPLLREPLTPEQVKPRLLGHWGTTPGLNLLYAHLSRVIAARGQDLIYVAGPGHGGPGMVANAWLEGTYSETYPRISADEAGMGRLFTQFSFPGGIPSHVAPETPGSIHEGGELGYSLSHAYGAALDNPDLVVACVIGDGEAETGPLAASWHSNKFLDPVGDGAVLPILHLNGYKIANPTVLARIGDDELTALLTGYGHKPYLVEGNDPATVHQQLAATMDVVFDEIAAIQQAARSGETTGRPRWPMIVLRTPKGWTGPKEVDGLPVEGTWRAHQVPLSAARDDGAHLAMLEQWMRSYRPEELFDESGAPRPSVVDWLPRGDLRMSANPHTNGGRFPRDLELPDFRVYAVKAGETAEATRVLGGWLRDVLTVNAPHRNFRLVGPDETESNRLGAVLEVTDKAWQADVADVDQHLGRHGRVMEILSETTCQGWLEGYLLTGRHGLFSCYEAFVHIVDSMFNQHAKWLRTVRHLGWRKPVPSLNYLLTSHVWRQDHNGASHQDPGFIDHVMNKKAEVVRVYLPPDANTLLSVADHCLRSRDYVNVIVAGKQPAPTWLDMDEAALHCARGLGIWDWASNDAGDPDVVLAAAGDVPTMEILAATDLLRRHLPDLKVRMVNVVDLMRLQPAAEHPHGLPDAEFDAIFTTDRPVVFAYHGYPWLIHRLTYRRAGHQHMHVRGFKEEGTTTTPFDMLVLNDMDRFHLVMDVIDRVPGLARRAAVLRQQMVDKRAEHRAYVRRTGEDLPEVREELGLAGDMTAAGRHLIMDTESLTHPTDTEVAAHALAEAAAAAGYAPSIHNTQPWRWRLSTGTLDLYLVPARVLPVTDPARQLATLSCGAALHHARVALAAQGWRATVTRMPPGGGPDLLARVHVEGRAPADPPATLHLRTVPIRHTDRRPVTGAPVDPVTLAAITIAVRAENTRLHPLRPDQVLDLAAAADHAQHAEEANPDWQAELAYWTGEDRPAGAGIPDAAIPGRGTQTTVPGRDFGHHGNLPVSAGHDEAATFVLLYGDTDEPAAWLRAGEALSAGWLTATELGVSVLPHSAPIEVGGTRQALRAMIAGVGHPYLVLRLGTPDPADPVPAHTSRLPAHQVIDHT